LNAAADFVARTGNAGSTGIHRQSPSEKKATDEADSQTAPERGTAGGTTGTGSLEHYVAFKVGVAATTAFLFFTTTTLVCFTLRVTQERMLKFTFLLHVSPVCVYVCMYVCMLKFTFLLHVSL
jgi:hypothetical protein